LARLDQEEDRLAIRLQHSVKAPLDQEEQLQALSAAEERRRRHQRLEVVLSDQVVLHLLPSDRQEELLRHSDRVELHHQLSEEEELDPPLVREVRHRARLARAVQHQVQLSDRVEQRQAEERSVLRRRLEELSVLSPQNLPLHRSVRLHQRLSQLLQRRVHSEVVGSVPSDPLSG